MPIGIAAPGPSGIPGFNESYGVRATPGGGSATARPLTSWLNVLTTVTTAADSVALPPAAFGMEVKVVNMGTASAQVFGNTNQFGVADTIANAAGTAQVLTGVALAANAVGVFTVLTPQAGPTVAPIAGTWQYKIAT